MKSQEEILKDISFRLDYLSAQIEVLKRQTDKSQADIYKNTLFIILTIICFIYALFLLETTFTNTANISSLCGF